MNIKMIDGLYQLALKEELLSKILMWLKTEGLYEECMKASAPELLKNIKISKKGD